MLFSQWRTCLRTSLPWEDADGLMFWLKPTGSTFGEEKQSLIFGGCYFLIEAYVHSQPCRNRGRWVAPAQVLHLESPQLPVLVAACALSTTCGMERVCSGHGQAVVRTGRHLCPSGCAAGIAGGDAWAQSEVWAWSTPVSLSLLFRLSWLLHGKQEFPSDKLIYGCSAETSSEIPMEGWVEGWSYEPQRDSTVAAQVLSFMSRAPSTESSLDMRVGF